MHHDAVAFENEKTPKITIRSCMEDTIGQLRKRLTVSLSQNLLTETCHILETAKSLRHLNARAEKAAQKLCWEQSTQRDKFRVSALDSEL